ncbi:NADPH-dependent F420 reductase [Frondihabitans cladoniiphilus]|uniref:NAD(P)-binding domain-containing protein n=1 Tax=Frondihabitans cladoniiphilus TaxID=715785 RepID=A0ABP8W4Y8_9MICO
MTTLGIIGAGNIGSQLARLGVRHGYDVVLSNSRGPETLGDLVAEIDSDPASNGPADSGLGTSGAKGSIRAATATEAAKAADIAVVTIPLKNYAAVPVEPLAGKIVIDTNNYYPQRDGQIAELDDESTTTAGLLQTHLGASHVVKAFNNIMASKLTTDATPTGTKDRYALPIAGDDAAAKATVTTLMDEFGFDVVDAGELSEGWRFQRDTPAYVTVNTVESLQKELAAAKRYRDM